MKSKTSSASNTTPPTTPPAIPPFAPVVKPLELDVLTNGDALVDADVDVAAEVVVDGVEVFEIEVVFIVILRTGIGKAVAMAPTPVRAGGMPEEI